MLRKIVVGGAAAAFLAVAGLAGASAPADAGVRVHIGVPGFYGYWGPSYPGYYYPPYPAYPSYPAYYGGYNTGYYGGPAYYGYYRNRGYYGGHYGNNHCRTVTSYKKVRTQNHGWVKKKVYRKTCW